MSHQNLPLEKTTKLWLLRPIKEWVPWYDSAFGFVVRASSEGEARHIASMEAGDEGKNAWLDSTLTKCVELPEDGDIGVVLRDFASA